MDPEAIKFDFEARAAVMQENVRTVVEFMQTIVAENEDTSKMMAKIQAGDIFAFATFLKDFERREEHFAALARVIRSF